ncbi:MAG: transcription-repair coupling factor, partial [Oscillospiraceae bacterium]|nr:transcription-repair coupling factor [Oscillospiraceae bacterium]
AKTLESRAVRARRRQNGEEQARRLCADAERLREGAALPWADRYMPFLSDDYVTALEYFPPDALVFLDAPNRGGERARELEEQLAEDVKLLLEAGIPVLEGESYLLPWREACRRLGEFAVVMGDAFAAGRYPLAPKSLFSANARQLPSYGGSVETALSDVKHYLDLDYRAVVLCADQRRRDVMLGMLEKNGLRPLPGLPDGQLPPAGRCCVAVGGLSAGAELPECALAVLTDVQIMAPALSRRKRRKAMADREKLGSCADLSVGDLVVHEHHGIGRFAGIFKIPVDGAEKDYIKICYAGTDSLYVPATQLDLVSKYIGGGEDHSVRLSRLGGAEWQRSKSRAKAAARELAGELTKLYAERSRTPGFAFSPDSPWQTEFEEAFGYAETDDQLRCTREIKGDMEQAVPMDRLLCGDVGYGKTEVALRAAMKCILDGKQCAFLVPTTVLARQHYQTASRRFFGYPVEIALLSRFNTPSQRKEILQKLRSGGVDLLIGTHSLLQKSVEFKDLGLLVVDEEQRFGVTHKEKLKEMSKGVDVLTLSATPIPRTLNMALSGLRSMSTLEEPPRDRQPVQTFVIEHDWDAVCDAIRRELLRGGQVYYLHNRVENIERTALRLQKLLEGVRVAVAHGKMDEEQLSRVMDDMAEGRIQVLVCTTIIETGIDIPNVNTLIVEDADKLGLAQLHQLRGRVGRSSRRASAYLTYRPEKALTEIAEKRLTAIREFAEFNAGFQIAMRDLEIRGAGNLLGAEQSGHMMDVGYDMYLKLLEEAVLEERGETPPVRTECSADLSVTANIPEKYVPSPEQRMDLYRRIALVRTEADADDLTDELIDRFGDPPPSVNALIHVALLRGEAGKAGISDIQQKNSMMYFTLVDFDMERLSALYARPEFKGRVKLDAGRTPRLGLKLRPGSRPIPEARALVNAWRATAPDPDTTQSQEKR